VTSNTYSYVFSLCCFSLIWFWQFFCPGLSSFGFFCIYLRFIFILFPWPFSRIICLSHILIQLDIQLFQFLWLTTAAFLTTSRVHCGFIYIQCNILNILINHQGIVCYFSAVALLYMPIVVEWPRYLVV